MTVQAEDTQTRASWLTPNRRRALRAGAVLIGLVVLTACAGDTELDTRTDLQGPEAQEIESFMNWVLIIAYIVFAGVLGVTALAWQKFRVKGEYEEDDWPEQIHGNNTLEIAWTIAPALVLALIGFVTIGVHNSINSEDTNPISVVVGGESVTWEPQVVVVGQQWWWEYQYHFGDVDVDQERVETLPQADIITATQMVVPIGTEIELEITSRDVIHSHWIPSLNGKRDAVPGRQSAPWKIEADTPGVYFGQCTEFCGLSHSRMRMQVVALPEAEFNAWITAQMEGVPLDADTAAYVDQLVNGDTPAPETPLERGVATFRAKCASCHLMEGVADDLWSQESVSSQLVSGAAPNLTHFSSRTTFAGGIRNIWDTDTGEFNEVDLRQWLVDPDSVKANFTEPDERGRLRGMPNLNLSTQEIDDLIGLLEITGPKPSPEVIGWTDVGNNEVNHAAAAGDE